MDRGEYYRRAKELLRREHAVLEAIFAGGVDALIARKAGPLVDLQLGLSNLVTRHQAIVAQMASLGREFQETSMSATSSGLETPAKGKPEKPE